MCNEMGITKDDGGKFEFGDDIPEGPERKLTDSLNEPILLIKFPTSLKSFYMQRVPGDPEITESVSQLHIYLDLISGLHNCRDLCSVTKHRGVSGCGPCFLIWSVLLRLTA